jgi:hypothetical protein
MFRPLADWIATTQISMFFQNQLWVVPTSQSIHILGVGVVFASTMMINLRMLGVGAGGRAISQMYSQLMPWVWRGLAVLLITGTIQTIAEPVRQFVTPAFWAKMSMVLLVVGMTAACAATVRKNSPLWDDAAIRPTRGKIFAVVSSLLWIAIITCGRLIGYTWVLYA